MSRLHMRKINQWIFRQEKAETRQVFLTATLKFSLNKFSKSDTPYKKGMKKIIGGYFERSDLEL